MKTNISPHLQSLEVIKKTANVEDVNIQVSRSANEKPY